MWATKHFGSMHHPLHDHSDSPLSGVYYVSIPKGAGAIEFRDPRFRGGDHNWAIYPKPGELIMFPGWLEHKVRPTFKRKESRDRISVAFNSASSSLRVLHFSRLAACRVGLPLFTSLQCRLIVLHLLKIEILHA